MRRGAFLSPRAGLATLAGAWAALLLAVAAAPPLAAETIKARLTLSAALRKTFAHDPRIRAMLAERAVAAAETLQAGKRPNPDLWFQAENVLGSQDYEGFKSAQLTLGLTQKLETGGKRTARVTAGEGKERVALAELRVARLEVGARVIQDFVKALGAARKLETEQAKEQRIRDLLPALRRRVQAGGSPESDVIRGELAAGRARIAVEKAEGDLWAARDVFAANWGGQGAEAVALSGTLLDPGARLTPLASLTPRLDRHPQVTRWDAEREARLAEFRLQQSLASPDVTLGLAGRRNNEVDSQGLVAQATIPLTLNDRNEGNIEAARLRLETISTRRAIDLASLRRELAIGYGTLRTRCAEARQYDEAILPKAERNIAMVQEGYEAGKYRVLEVLDAVTVATDVKVQKIAALVECNAASAVLRSLTGVDPLTGRKIEDFE